MTARRDNGEDAPLNQRLLEGVVARRRTLAGRDPRQRRHRVLDEVIGLTLMLGIGKIAERRGPAALRRRTIMVGVGTDERKRRSRQRDRHPLALLVQMLHQDLRRHVQDVVIPIEDVVLEVPIADLFIDIGDRTHHASSPSKSNPQTFTSFTRRKSPTCTLRALGESRR